MPLVIIERLKLVDYNAKYVGKNRVFVYIFLKFTIKFLNL